MVKLCLQGLRRRDIRLASWIKRLAALPASSLPHQGRYCPKSRMSSSRSTVQGKRQIHQQGGKQYMSRSRRLHSEDFEEYEQYSKSQWIDPPGGSKLVFIVKLHTVPLDELPVLTKQGIRCSLRDYTEGIRHERAGAQRPGLATLPQFHGNPTDVPPPPYVECVENDISARKDASPVPSIRRNRDHGSAKKDQNGEQWRIPTCSGTCILLTRPSCTFTRIQLLR